MSIRSPMPGEAATIARVHVDAWRETYSRLLPNRFFDDATFQRLRAMWERLLAAENQRHTIRVAEDGGCVIGFGCASVSPDDDGELALGMLYLLAGHHGSGVGQGLLDGVIGDRPASLWMAQDNPRALAFYRRNRFEASGETRLDESFDNLPEIRLVR